MPRPRLVSRCSCPRCRELPDRRGECTRARIHSTDEPSAASSDPTILCRCRNAGELDCGGYCADSQADDGNCGACGHDCPLGECVAGSCTCLATTCGAACADLSTNNFNCGACSHACASDEVCNQGSCDCDAGTARCGLGCVDTTTDTNNCGACGSACGSNQYCSGGDCFCEQDWLTTCGTDCVVSFQSDNDHCGRCFNKCPFGQICSFFDCEPN